VVAGADNVAARSVTYHDQFWKARGMTATMRAQSGAGSLVDCRTAAFTRRLVMDEKNG
jgi:hypothetical protein